MPQISLDALPEIFRSLKELNISKITLSLPHDFIDFWAETEPYFTLPNGEEIEFPNLALNELLVDIMNLYRHPKTELTDGEATGHGWSSSFKIKVSSQNLGSMSLLDYSVTYLIGKKRKPVSIIFGMHSQIDEDLDFGEINESQVLLGLQAH